MNENVELKKYFLEDVELTSIDEDKLGYKNVVRNLEHIIDETETPFNIALTGKSGTGKSSIINFLTEKYKNDIENYNVEKINVWKDDVSLKEYLDSTFNVKSAEDTSNNDQNEESANSSKENAKVQETNANKKQLSKPLKVILAVCNLVLTFVACFFITSIIFLLMEYLQNINVYRNGLFFVENAYLNYSDNFMIIMMFSLALTIVAILIYKLFIKRNGNTVTKSKDAENISSVTESNVNSKIEEVSLNRRNIIILEDIDKLSVAKMLKRLEEIKYCSNYKNCIFIIPLDKDMLKKAIEVRNAIKPSAKYRPLSFETVLDKVFQFKIYMPQVSSKILKQYAIELVEEKIPNFIEEYCEIPAFEDIIKNVLIYKYVTTPRHVKKLLNNFVNNKILISEKIRNEQIDESFVKQEGFDVQIAKLSVLQLDFESFYDLVLKDFRYINKLTYLYNLDIEDLKANFDNIDDELKPFFKSKYKPLKSFLKQTENFSMDDIAILMYLIEDQDYSKFLEMVAINYNDNPDEAFNLFKSTTVTIPSNVMSILYPKLKENLTAENFDEIFEFVRANSDFFYEENGNVSEYVQFLVDNINLSSNPNEVIKELDENFTRIGKVYELNKNIKNLNNFDYDKAYEFMGKCLDNGDLDRMVYVINSILSDNKTVQDCLNIEEKMSNYDLVDVIECDVDDIIACEEEEENKVDTDDSSDKSIENAKLLKNNYVLLKNILEICTIKQDVLAPVDVMKIVQKVLENVNQPMFIIEVFSIMKKLDRMYFYEIRRDFNEIIYASFHNAKNDAVREAALNCTRYFKNTRLFKTKLNKEEEKFYSEN